MVAVAAFPLWSVTSLFIITKATTLGFVSPLGLILIGLSAVLGGLMRRLWRLSGSSRPLAPTGSTEGIGEVAFLLLQRLPLLLCALLLDVVVGTIAVRRVVRTPGWSALSGAGEVALWGGVAGEILLFLFALGLTSRLRTSRPLRWMLVAIGVGVFAVCGRHRDDTPSGRRSSMWRRGAGDHCSALPLRHWTGPRGSAKMRHVWRRAAALLMVTVVSSAALAGCSEYPKAEFAPWVVVESSPDSPTLHIRAWFRSCSSFVRTEVHETASSVRLRAVVRTTSDSCKSDLLVQELIVVLDAPLGDRTVQGECDQVAAETCAGMKASPDTATT